jgi:hypothetical protein
MGTTRRILAGMIPIAVVAALGCGGAKESAKPVTATAPPPPSAYPACAGLEEKAHGVWSPKIRDQLDFSVHIFEGKILAADAELAVNRLDEFTSTWLTLASRECQSHSDEGTLDGDDYRGLTACLDRALETQRSVIDAMKTGGKTAIAQAQTLPETVKGCAGEAISASATTDMRANPFGGKP